MKKIWRVLLRFSFFRSQLRSSVLQRIFSHFQCLSRQQKKFHFAVSFNHAWYNSNWNLYSHDYVRVHSSLTQIFPGSSFGNICGITKEFDWLNETWRENLYLDVGNNSDIVSCLFCLLFVKGSQGNKFVFYIYLLLDWKLSGKF
jgi:hypothetical protein